MVCSGVYVRCASNLGAESIVLEKNCAPINNMGTQFYVID